MLPRERWCVRILLALWVGEMASLHANEFSCRRAQRNDCERQENLVKIISCKQSGWKRFCLLSISCVRLVWYISHYVFTHSAAGGDDDEEAGFLVESTKCIRLFSLFARRALSLYSRFHSRNFLAPPKSKSTAALTTRHSPVFINFTPISASNYEATTFAPSFCALTIRIEI